MSDPGCSAGAFRGCAARGQLPSYHTPSCLACPCFLKQQQQLLRACVACGGRDTKGLCRQVAARVLGWASTPHSSATKSAPWVLPKPPPQLSKGACIKAAAPTAAATEAAARATKGTCTVASICLANLLPPSHSLLPTHWYAEAPTALCLFHTHTVMAGPTCPMSLHSTPAVACARIVCAPAALASCSGAQPCMQGGARVRFRTCVMCFCRLLSCSSAMMRRASACMSWRSRSTCWMVGMVVAGLLWVLRRLLWVMHLCCCTPSASVQQEHP